MTLTREQLEESAKARTIAGIVKVEAFGGEVCVRLMKLGDRDSYEHMILENGGKLTPDFSAQILHRTLCDEKGDLLYPGPDGLEAIKLLPTEEARKVWEVAMRHNGMTEGSVREIAGE